MKEDYVHIDDLKNGKRVVFEIGGEFAVIYMENGKIVISEIGKLKRIKPDTSR